MAWTLGQAAANALTRREREVARLVSEGLSNKEVAQRLSLSERTVEGHVASICNKLGFHSRVQIASWVAQQASVLSSGSTTGPSLEFHPANLPPLWVLVVMAVGAPLPVGAIVYQWTQSPGTDAGSAAVGGLITVAALAFIVVPAVGLLGLVTSRPWSQAVVLGGMLATGSVVLVVGTVTLLVADWTGKPFHPANWFETLYAASLIPVLLMHAAAAFALVRGHPWARPLVTIASAVWIIRFGYGLSLGGLVIWLLWIRPGRGLSSLTSPVRGSTRS